MGFGQVVPKCRPLPQLPRGFYHYKASYEQICRARSSRRSHPPCQATARCSAGSRGPKAYVVVLVESFLVTVLPLLSILLVKFPTAS